MKFEKVFEVCKEIVPLVQWGPKVLESLPPEGSKTICAPYVYATIVGKDMQTFDKFVDSIWKNNDKSVYYNARNEIEEYILSVAQMISLHGEEVTKNDSELRSRWDNLLNRPMETFTVWHPIYGVTAEHVVELGSFLAFNIKCHQKDIEERLGIKNIQEQIILSRIDPEVYLVTLIQAKSHSRAKELARTQFELFENIAKFCLKGVVQYDIGIFNYNGDRSEEGIVISSNNTTVVSSSSKGAWKSIELEKLSKENFSQIWTIMNQYIEKRSTEFQKRLIHAIQWIGKANGTESNENKFVQYIFALESLLAFRPKGEMITPSIANQLAEYGAFIAGEQVDTRITTKLDLRRKMFKDIKKIYSERSKIVHGHGEDCSAENVFLARDVMYTLIDSILSNEELLHFTSMDQLSAWVETKKFANM